jgi:prepilin-type N-terminal cleavage/methylation domain-containing protein/prepilin-type processing-associated H-X9-DG protein
MKRENEGQDSGRRYWARGFTLIELLVVISIIGLLIGLSVPALSRARENARRTKCLSNVRQLQIALQLYADSHDGRVPPRDYEAGAVWVDRLEPYYADRKLLCCPTDRGRVDQSYLMNGFIDYFVMNSFRGNWDEFFGVYKDGGFPAIRLSSIPEPAKTITIGEKRADSDDDSYMDIWPPQYGSDHLTEVAHGKHRSGGKERNGGSNYAFADGSARFLRYGEAFSPKNLWAVTEQFRNAALPEL